MKTLPQHLHPQAIEGIKRTLARRFTSNDKVYDEQDILQLLDANKIPKRVVLNGVQIDCRITSQSLKKRPIHARIRELVDKISELERLQYQDIRAFTDGKYTRSMRSSIGRRMTNIYKLLATFSSAGINVNQYVDLMINVENKLSQVYGFRYKISRTYNWVSLKK